MKFLKENKIIIIGVAICTILKMSLEDEFKNKMFPVNLSYNSIDSMAWTMQYMQFYKFHHITYRLQ